MKVLKPTGRVVSTYAESFSDEAVSSVMQFLEVFSEDRSEELFNKIRDVVHERRERLRITAEANNKRRKELLEKQIGEYEMKERMAKEDGKFPGEPSPMPVIGFCPKCGRKLLGMFISDCETRKSGRVFYKQCSSCSYYSELFKRRNKHVEVEGG